MKTIVMGLVALVVLTTACGTIFRGTKEEVSIKSEPECKVYVDGAEYKTPVVVKLNRGSSHQIKFEKEGVSLNVDALGDDEYYVVLADKGQVPADTPAGHALNENE